MSILHCTAGNAVMVKSKARCEQNGIDDTFSRIHVNFLSRFKEDLSRILFRQVLCPVPTDVTEAPFEHLCNWCLVCQCSAVLFRDSKDFASPPDPGEVHSGMTYGEQVSSQVLHCDPRVIPHQGFRMRDENQIQLAPLAMPKPFLMNCVDTWSEDRIDPHFVAKPTAACLIQDLESVEQKATKYRFPLGTTRVVPPDVQVSSSLPAKDRCHTWNTLSLEEVRYSPCSLCHESIRYLRS